MESNPSSSSSSLKIISQTCPHKTFNYHLSAFLTTAVVLILCLTPTTVLAQSISDFESKYDLHCTSTVPRPPSAAGRFAPPSSSPTILRSGYFRGGAPILNQTLTTGGKILVFRPYSSHGTTADGLHEFSATLHLRESSPAAIGEDSDPPPRNQRRFRLRGPGAGMRLSQLSFQLRGFWSEISKEVCMVGPGSSLVSGKTRSISLYVVLKLHYPQNSTIYGSLVRGSLESLASTGDHSQSYFEPISILSVAQDPSHEYTLVQKGSDSNNHCLSRDHGEEEESYRVSALPDNGCSILRRVDRFELAYHGDCNSLDCNPVGGFLGFVPRYVFFYWTVCGTSSGGSKDKKWQMLLSFPNSSSGEYRFPYDPRTTLVAEGIWNEKEDRFCGVGCRILNFTESFENAYIGDCSTGFSFRFPSSLSLRKRVNLVGKIWSNSNGSGHSGEIGFSDLNKRLMNSLGAKYEYTVIGSLRKTCTATGKFGRGKGKKYPNEYSSDMMFDMVVKISKGLNAIGFSRPFVVGDRVSKNQFHGFPGVYPQVMTEVSVVPNITHNSLVNISYEMSFSVPTSFNFTRGNFPPDEVKISAEGTYNKNNGVLCMIGCRNIGSKALNDSFDCEIAITVQFSPLNSKTNKDIKGSIESTRESSDPLYFDRLEFTSTSIYTGQADESIWRMDLEITMVLISNTLTCLFVGFQLFYIKTHSERLPFASIAMHVVLTVAHMIPLVLNFEAMFVSRRNPRNDFLGSGGWLEANEVIVRIVTMVAFLLQLRLLQLTWTSRKGNPNETSLWSSERKVLYVTVPLYVLGALIAWFANHLKNTTVIKISALRNPRFQRQSLVGQHSLWKDLKSYAGLVMDGFLLPQILFNLFMGSGEKALTPLFYFGTTLVRLMPHAYDLYRAHTYSPNFMDWSYIYANHRMDFFSTAWDIVIPLSGLLLAVLIFLQQRFGGRWILPRRFRQSSEYVKVSVIGNDDL